MKRPIKPTMLRAALSSTLALCAASLPPLVHADVVIEQQNEKVYYARIIDVITQNDYETLVAKVAALQGNKRSPTIHYVLNSGGGNVEAALSMGRFLRKENAQVLVEEGDICISSCVLVLAGAPQRKIAGIVGLQRPYEAADAKMSADDQTAKYAKFGALAKAYLIDMNVNQNLYADMLPISPLKVRALSEQSLVRYGLVPASVAK